jgi:hypothetical protein
MWSMHLDRVVLQDADVGQALFADALEQGAHAGFVHFAAQEVVSGRTRAMCAVASPMPKPISSTSGRAAAKGGAWRPAQSCAV